MNYQRMADTYGERPGYTSRKARQEAFADLKHVRPQLAVDIYLARTGQTELRIRHTRKRVPLREMD